MFYFENHTGLVHEVYVQRGLMCRRHDNVWSSWLVDEKNIKGDKHRHTDRTSLTGSDSQEVTIRKSPSVPAFPSFKKKSVIL